MYTKKYANKRTSRILASAGIVLSLLALAVLTGCGRGDSADDGKIVVGFSQATMNHPWRVAMVDRNKKYAAEHYKNVELIVTDGQDDAQKQVTDMETLIARQPDVILLSPVTADALTPVAKRAMEAGISVVTLDRKVNTPVTAHIGGDNVEIGAQAARFIADKLGGKGNVVEIQGTAGASATNDRHQGFSEEMKKYPGIKIVADDNADYMRDKATTFMEDVTQRFAAGEIDAVFAHNDEMALGAQRALSQAGRDKDVIVVGIDGQNNAIQAVKDGKLAATFTYHYLAPEAIQAAYRIATGEDVPKDTTPKSTQIDQSNAAKYIGNGF